MMSKSKYVFVILVLFYLLSINCIYAKDSKLIEMGNEIDSFYKKGEFDKAIEKSIEIIKYAEKEYGKDSKTVVKLKQNLAILYKNTGRHKEAEKLFTEVMTTINRLYKKDIPLFVAVAGNKANLYTEQKKYKKAEKIYLEVIKLIKENYSDENMVLALNKNNLAELYLATKRYKEAKALLVEALAIAEKKLGADHPNNIVLLKNLAIAYSNLNQPKKTETLLQRILVISEKAFGKNNLRLIGTLTNLADLAYSFENYDKSAGYLERALEICRKDKNTKSEDLLYILEKLANSYVMLEKIPDIIPLSKEAIEIREKIYPQKDPGLPAAYTTLGMAYKRAGNLKEAELNLRKSLELSKKYKHKTDDSYLFLALAQVYQKTKEFPKAEAMFQKAIEIEEKNKKNKNIVNMLSDYSVLLKNMGKIDEALKLNQKALDIQKKKTCGKDPMLILIMVNRATFYVSRKDYDKGEAILKETLDIVGPDNINSALILSLLGDIAYENMQVLKSEEKYNDSINLYKKLSKKPGLPIASAIGKLADLYVNTNRLSKAVPLMQEVIKIREEKLHPSDPLLILTYHQVGRIYNDLGKYSEAEKYLNQAIELCEKYHKDNAAFKYPILITKANYYFQTGRWDESEKLYKDVVNSTNPKDKAVSNIHARALNNLGVLLKEQGRYGEALDLYNRSLEIYKREVGEKHPNYARILSNIAEIYYLQGKYSQSEAIFQRALEIKRRNLGENDPSIATTLASIANLQHYQGRNAASLKSIEEALKITKKAFGKFHPTTGKLLSNFATLYTYNRKYEKATELLTRASKIFEKVYGKDSYARAAILNNLGAVELAQKKYKTAIPYFQESLEITRKVLGENHPNIAILLGNLGELVRIKGDFKKALDYFQQAYNIEEKVLGESHPQLATSLNRLSKTYSALKDNEKALVLINKALAIEDKTIRNIFNLASEKEKLQFLEASRVNTAFLLSLVINYFPNNPAALTDAMNTVLRRKGLVLEALSRERNALQKSENPKIKTEYNKLRKLSSLISSMTMSSINEKDTKYYKSQLEKLQGEWEKADKELTRLSSLYANKKEARYIDCSAISEKLPANSVLVEYFTTRIANFQEKDPERLFSGYKYFVFILPSSRDLHKGKKIHPILINLGDASLINHAILEYRKEIIRVRKLWENGILDEGESERRLAEKGKAIFALAIEPVLEKTGKSKTLYVAPDGNLNLVPFDSLQDESGKYLIEKYKINLLSCGRDLMLYDKQKGGNRLNIVVADPDYSLSAKNRPDSLKELVADSKSILKDDNFKSEKMKNPRWSSLPETRKEAEEIAKILKGEKVRTYLGKFSLEEVVKNADSPLRLHIATHGFFFNDQKAGFSQNINYEKGGNDANSPAIINLSVENPLLRSGLLLAGANRLGKEKTGQFDDGILTALEISGMKLQGTDLVVLSACETGLGEARMGEGIYGLRRAFQLAGARTVVMSLWSVPDRETRELMTGYYKNLKSGKKKSESLREAAIKMIENRRKETGAAHPFFWGAFISVGEP